MMKSNFVGCSTGISAGLVPLKIYGQSVCEAKINPAPKSIAKKLVTKESPLAAKDTIMAPRVSTLL
jgi:hypothetical protein